MSTSEAPRKFTLASRASQLAQIQTNIVRDALTALHPGTSFETSFMTTGGDHNQSQALYLLGGKALWTKELEVALAEGAVDMLVHSFKDVPTTLPAGMEIAGVLEREDPVDCLVVRKGESWKSLEELPDGSVVGTSSVRRVAQLKRRFPKLVFKDVVSLRFSCGHIANIALKRTSISTAISRAGSEGTCKHLLRLSTRASPYSERDVFSRAFCVQSGWRDS